MSKKTDNFESIMTSGIYKISSKIFPEKFYIGSAKSLSRREKEHFGRLQSVTHPNKILQNHFNKYGKSDFVFDVLEFVCFENLIASEQIYIDKLNPHFNICKIAGSTLGRPQSTETRAKRSAKLKGRKYTNTSGYKLGALARYGDVPKSVNGFVFVSHLPNGSNRSRRVEYKCGNCNKIYRDSITKYKSCKPCKCMRPKKNIDCPAAKAIRITLLKLTQSERSAQQPKRIDNTTGFIGVHRHRDRFRARIKKHGQWLEVGYYNTATEAAIARNQYIAAHSLPHTLNPTP